MLKKKDKDKNKGKGNTNPLVKREKTKSIQKIPNNNFFDHTPDVDEFSSSINEPQSESISINKINKISSIQININNINQIDSLSRNKIEIQPSLLHNNCITEPEENFYSRQYSESFCNNMVNPLVNLNNTPQKMRNDNSHFNVLINKPGLNQSGGGGKFFQIII